MSEAERQTVIDALGLALEHALEDRFRSKFHAALAIMRRRQGPSPEMLALRAAAAAETIKFPRG